MLLVTVGSDEHMSSEGATGGHAQKGGAFALYFSPSRRESKKERKEWKFIPTPLSHLPIL